jgi:hypothetical protein
MRFMCRVSSCDYPSPVCGPGSGHIGQGRFVKGTPWVMDASFKEERSETHNHGIV